MTFTVAFAEVIATEHDVVGRNGANLGRLMDP